MGDHEMSRIILVAAVVVELLVGADAQAQGRAEGSYPAVISCDKLPFTAGSVRDRFVLEITSGKAAYSRKLTSADGPDAAGGTETGTGRLSGGRLSLSGRAKTKSGSFEARYIGEVSGTGGLLTGIQTWTYRGQSYQRPCQISVGDGRG
ncbi:hypothetical protein [uncultured Enterovirga sp.]|uniref:hypothetical protein n=1 Tax=uncultured Enterovirga sp. TaxID=2026352 RepID=UPI0035CA5548